MNEAQRRRQRLRVAAFLSVTVTALVILLVLLGRSESLFSRQATLHASFDDVGGLLVGSTVRLAGVEVGVVEGIHFSPDPKIKRVNVDLGVAARYLERVHQDSVARMSSKGLLGDMVVDITVGEASQPPVQDGATLRSAEAASLAHAMEEAEQVIGGVKGLVNDVDQRVKDVLTPQVAQDVGRITHSAAALIDDVRDGQGLAHRLVYDRALADEAGALAARADHGMVQLDALLTQARDGDGLLHGLLYAKGGARTAEDLRRMADDFAGVADQVRTGPGLAHTLVYEDQRRGLFEDLGETAEETDQGKGTLGGLLKDPTAYEDLTSLLGNLRRNDLLKTVIRLTISKDGLARPEPKAPAYGGSGAAGRAKRPRDGSTP
jgi:phospholipid/cholesterol/gamma-HCH transport system substrate-binding protein